MQTLNFVWVATYSLGFTKESGSEWQKVFHCLIANTCHIFPRDQHVRVHKDASTVPDLKKSSSGKTTAKFQDKNGHALSHIDQNIDPFWNIHFKTFQLILGTVHASELDQSQIDLSQKWSGCERSNANRDRSEIDLNKCM